jgi:hypothetical protein
VHTGCPRHGVVVVHLEGQVPSRLENLEDLSGS